MSGCTGGNRPKVSRDPLKMLSARKVVLITGASSGLGLSTANLLTESGYSVYGISRNPDKYSNKNNSFKFTLIKADVTREEDVQSVIRQITAKEESLDVVINNAGMGIAGAVENTTLAAAHQLMGTNFFGVLSICKTVLPIFKNQQRGLIINVSSLGGLAGLPFQSIYSASKYAIEGFSEALYQECHQQNIKVVLIEPGDFRTGFTANRAYSESELATNTAFNSAMEVIRNDEQNGEDPQIFARKIAMIIKLKNPAFRYMVGHFDQKLSLKFRKIIPDKIFLSLLRKHYKVEFSGI